MNEISPLNISKLLEKERHKGKKLEKELENIKEQLSLCKGAILAYEQLLSGTTSNDSNLDEEDIIINSPAPSEDMPDSSTRDTPSKPRGKKKRAARATKAEMEHRKKVVVRILKKRGDMTPKDLNPLVDEVLGKPLEAHHLRAVLRRFTKIFEAKEEHGLWGLTQQGHALYEKISDEEEDTSEENSD